MIGPVDEPEHSMKTYDNNADEGSEITEALDALYSSNEVPNGLDPVLEILQSLSLDECE